MKKTILLLILPMVMACNSKVPSLGSLPSKRPSVLVFLSADCPVSQKYVSIINQIAKKYPQIDVVGVFPENEASEVVSNFKKTQKGSFNVKRDRGNTLIHTLNIGHTPEAVFLSADHKVLYRGAIDNWYYNLEAFLPQPTEHFLADAIEQYLAGLPIKLETTRTVGCRIEQ